MIKKLLIGVGLFTLGYVVGKAVERAESELGGQLGWDGEEGVPERGTQAGEDAQFSEPVPSTARAGSHSA